VTLTLNTAGENCHVRDQYNENWITKEKGCEYVGSSMMETHVFLF
jgi:hypothetical protein